MQSYTEASVNLIRIGFLDTCTFKLMQKFSWARRLFLWYDQFYSLYYNVVLWGYWVQKRIYCSDWKDRLHFWPWIQAVLVHTLSFFEYRWVNTTNGDLKLSEKLCLRKSGQWTHWFWKPVVDFHLLFYFDLFKCLKAYFSYSFSFHWNGYWIWKSW